MGDDPSEGNIIQLDMFFRDTVFLELPGQQVPFGNLQFLFQGIAGQPNDLHTVKQRRRDGINQVGRGDEHYLGQVIGQVEIMV